MLKKYKYNEILSLLAVVIVLFTHGISHAVQETVLVPTNAVIVEENTINRILPYLRIDSGWARFHKTPNLVLIKEGKLTSNTHNVVGAGVGLGVSFGDKVRADINWIRHIYPTLSLSQSNFTIKRKPLIDAAFLNLYYETGLELSILRPYIGGGVGIAVQKDKLSYYTYNNQNTGRVLYTSSRKANFAYRFMLGSAFDLNETIKLDVSYSYNDYGKSKAVNALSNKKIGTTHYRAHMITAGLRFGI